jgi:hypothetical protein
MNQFFSFNRFLLLVRKHWADNKKRYGLSLLAFAGLLTTWFVFTMLTGFENTPMGREVQTITYFFALFAIGTFYASQYFSDLGSRARGINFLLVPASTFEKLLCGLLFTVVFFFLLYTATFYAVDAVLVAVAKSLPRDPINPQEPSVVNVFHIISVPFNQDTTLNFLLYYFTVQAAFLLGSVYFEKYSFIKTVICCFVAGFILFLLLFFFNEKMLPRGDYFRGFFTTYRVYVEGGNDHLVQLPSWMGEVLRFLVTYALPPFLWTATYFRLKEKQV